MIMRVEMAKSHSKPPSLLSPETRSQVRFIAGVVVGTFTATIALFGWLFKASLLPALDDVYDISDYFAAKQEAQVQSAIAAADSVRAGKVDSGYSESFRFAAGQPFVPELLLFFAVPRQKVTITMSAVPLNRVHRDILFEAQVDGIPWDTLLVPDRAGPIRSSTYGLITSKLQFVGAGIGPVGPEGQNIHEVRIVPLDTIPMRSGEDVLVNVLVLVHVDEDKQSAESN